MTPSDSLTAVLAFFGVLVLIPLVLWLLRRTPVGGGRGEVPLRSVANLPLAPNQRVAIVEVGTGEERRWLVLGVTPGQISTLWTMPPQTDAPSAMATPNAQFSQLLSRLKGVEGPTRGR